MKVLGILVNTIALLAGILSLSGCETPIETKTVYTVNFDSQGGTQVSSQEIAPGLLVIEPASPYKYGAVFGGWFLESTGVSQWNFKTDKVRKSLTLYAAWSAVLSTVTYDSQGGSGISAVVVSYGSRIVAPSAPTKSGFIFGGWYKDSTCNSVWNFAQDRIEESKTLFAKWNLGYTVSYDGNGNTSGDVPSDAGLYSELSTAVVFGNTGGLEKAGSTFAGWTSFTSGIGLSYVPSSTVAIGNANVTLFAIWIPAILKYTAQGNSIVVTGLYSTPNGPINIPAGVTGISASAFHSQSFITAFFIPASVKTIGEQAFFSTKLTSLIIPEGVATIEQQTFYACFQLTTVALPSTLTRINTQAFAYDGALSIVNLPTNLAVIETEAFMSCQSLTSLTLPEKITTISTRAFSGCKSLSTVALSSKTNSLGVQAFSGCSSLQEITLPGGTVSIGDQAFTGCTSLSKVNLFATTPPTLGSKVFENTADSLKIYVPGSSISAYRNAPGWTLFSDRIFALE